jgi:outer membrane murein-binding lipoprotein Lpp
VKVNDTKDTSRRAALMDYGDGGRHGDPLRRHLGSPRCRFALGVHLPASADGQQVIWFVDGLAELIDGGSNRGKTSAFAQVVGQLIGQVKQLRAENAALQDEVQSLASDLDRACEGRIGGVA